MMFRFSFLFAFLFVAGTLSAQMERTMYQVFEIDSARIINLDIAGIYEVSAWAGSSILVETNIQISHASPEILSFLIKEGRYDVKSDTISPTEVKIYTRFRERKPIKTPDGECTEIATTRFFVPDWFTWTDDKKTLTKKPD